MPIRPTVVAWPIQPTADTLGTRTGRGLARDTGATRRPVALVRRRKKTAARDRSNSTWLRRRIAGQRSDAQPRTKGAYGPRPATLGRKALEKVAQHGRLRLIDVVLRNKALQTVWE